MESLKKFLREYRCKKEACPNWGSLRGGLWKVPREKRFTFYSLVSSALPSWNVSHHMGFVFRPPHTFLQQFLLDLDFQTPKEVVLELSMCTQYARIVAKMLQDDLKQDIAYLVVKKDKGYWSKIKGENVFKTGCHLYFPGTRVDLADSTRYRARCVERIRECFGSLGYTNTENDVCDKRIPFRENGLMMIGDYKPGGKGGRYAVKVAGYLRGNSFTEDVLSKERFISEIGNYYESIYGFVFEGPDPGWKPTVKPKKKVKPKKEILNVTGSHVQNSQTKVVQKDVSFDLEEFLRCTKGWVPDESDYKQVCMFCETQGLDPTECNRLCNAAWGYTDTETQRLMENYNGSLVTRRSMIRLLQNHAVCEWVDAKIFPGRCYHYFNESRMFNEKQVWNIREVERFFTDVICTTWGSGDTEFIYKEKLTKRYGDTYYPAINTVIRGDIPFSTAKSDKLILVEPPLNEIVKVLRKLANTKTPHFKQTDGLDVLKMKKESRDKIVGAQNLVKHLKSVDNETEKYKLIKSFLGDDFPEPVEKSLSSILTKYKQRPGSKFREYHSYVVMPYLWKDNTPSDQINIFPGFDMMKFAKVGDVTKTRFWHWLWVAWANRDTYKMDWLLSYFAFKLQNPHRKVQKFLIAFCNDCGCGKTSIRPFLECIYGVDKTLFCEDIADLQKDENSEFLNKMWCIVDDIEKAGRKVSDSLKSKISSDTFKYKRLYHDRKTMPSYLDLIATSNAREPTFVGNDNRRTELVVINPELKGNRDFWKGFYGEDCKNPEIAGIWFNYLAHKELTLDVTDPFCRFDITALQKLKVKSMKLVHRFVIEFMQHEECFESSFDRFRDVRELWWTKLKFPKEDGIKTCLIEYRRLYRYFTHWRKVTGQKIHLKESTFFDDLLDLGLKKVRRTIDSHKIRVVVFRAPYVRQAIKTFYKLDTCPLSWCWTGDQFETYQKRNFQFTQFTGDRRDR